MGAAALLLTAGFLLHPVFVFMGIVPLFELADRAKEKSFLRRLGKLPLILLWLAVEYIALWFGENFFLGRAFAEKEEWIRWATYTGFSGVSLWILIANLLLYRADFLDGRPKWIYAAVFVIVIVGPILYSYTLPPKPAIEVENEWIARTAAWISVLILLSAFVKQFIRKK